MKPAPTVLFAIKDGSFFKKMFHNIGEIASEISLKLDQNGMSFQGMDVSHVSMINFVWKKEDFDIYNVKTKKVYGLSIVNLNKILKALPPKGSVQFSENSSSDKISISLFNDTGINYNFEFKLMNIECDDLAIPDLIFTHQVIIQTEILKNIILNIEDLLDKILIEINTSEVKFSGIGDIANIECQIAHNTKDIDTNVICSLSPRFLKMFLNCVASPFTKLSLTENNPAYFEFEFLSQSKVSFYLATKIDD